LAEDFELVQAYRLDQLTVNRYRAGRPVRVRPADLVAPATLGEALILVPG
jgi:hypothetical protein